MHIGAKQGSRVAVNESTIVGSTAHSLRRPSRFSAVMGWVAIGTSLAAVVTAARVSHSASLVEVGSPDRIAYERVLGPSVSSEIASSGFDQTDLGYRWHEHDVTLRVQNATQKVSSISLFLDSPSWEKGGREELADLLGMEKNKLTLEGKHVKGLPARIVAELSEPGIDQNVTLTFR